MEDYAQKMTLLRELYDRIKKKEDVQEADYIKAGIKNKARLKDIEKEISITKKKVSHSIKQVIAQEEEEDLQKIALEKKVTIEELKASLDENERNSDLNSTDRALRHRLNRQRIAKERDGKIEKYHSEIGKYDLYVDYV